MAGPWLSRTDYQPTDRVKSQMFNNLALDDRTWGGDVNGGGFKLSNVILDGSGGFTSQLSPLVMTPGADGSSRIELDQGAAPNNKARWNVGKDAAAETGANAGSNFQIVRYADDGTTVLGTPFAVNRATGVITMGAQKWTGAVDGNGQTLSNVTITGYATNPMTTKGDIIIGGTSGVPARLGGSGTDGWVLTYDLAGGAPKWAAPPATGVPTSRAINTPAGSGLSGGGTLAADLTLQGVIFGASGAPHAKGMVPDPGATAGATRFLREDATWGVPTGTGGGMSNPMTAAGDLIVGSTAGAPTNLAIGTNGQVLTVDTTVTPIKLKWAAGAGGLDVRVNSTSYGIASILNLIAGTNVTLGASSSAGATNVTFNAAGGGAGSQTPWTSDIDGAGFTLKNAGKILIGTSTFSVSTGQMQVAGGAVESSTRWTNTASPSGVAVGVTATSSNAFLWNYENGPLHLATNNLTRLYITAAGNVGIGTTNPQGSLDVRGSGPAQFHDTATGPVCYVSISESSTINNIQWWKDSTPTVAASIGLSSPSTALGGNIVFATFNGSAWTDRMIVLNSNGNVGIGTTNPLNLVQVHAGTDANVGIRLDSQTGNSVGFGAYNDAGSNVVPLGFNASKFIFMNGSVGIGTTSPGSRLAVISTASIDGVTISSFDRASIWMNVTNTSNYNWLLQSAVSANNDFQILASSAPGGAASNAVVTLRSTGSVGIGTTSPADMLALAPVAFAGSVNGGIRMQSTGGEWVYRLAMKSTSGGNTYFAIDSAINASGGVTEAIRIAGATVAIAKNAMPAYPLDVTGDINCTGAFRVNGVAIAAGGIVVQAGGTAVGTSTPRPILNFTSGGSSNPACTEDGPNNRYNVTFNFSSDVRLKRNVADLQGGLSVIEQLRPVAFEYNGAGGFAEGKRSVAIIAQELQQVMPDCVYSVRQRLYPEAEETDLLCYEPTHILFHLVLAVKQLHRQLSELRRN